MERSAREGSVNDKAKTTAKTTETKATDQGVLDHIQGLVEEEERLYKQSGLSHADRERLGKINVELDQCWDLLRQRRALREFGQDPDEAKVRSPKIVENYEG